MVVQHLCCNELHFLNCVDGWENINQTWQWIFKFYGDGVCVCGKGSYFYVCAVVISSHVC